MSNLITIADLNTDAKNYYVYRRKSGNLSQIPHYHDYFHLCYLVSGEACHCQGNDSIVLHPGDVFIVPPGFYHRLKFLAPNTEVYTIAFYEAIFPIEYLQSSAFYFLKNLQTDFDTGIIPLSLTPDPDQRNSIEALIHTLMREQNANCPQELCAAPTLIMSVVYILAQCYYRNPHNHRHPWSQADNAQLLRRCIAYIDTHYTEHLTPDLLAKQFGFSRSSLCHALQQHTGLPLHKYVSMKRIQRAQLLIRTDPELPLSRIAGQVGYEDDSTFYRNFLKVTGISPSGFRELCRENNKA